MLAVCMPCPRRGWETAPHGGRRIARTPPRRAPLPWQTPIATPVQLRPSMLEARTSYLR